ncbi:hypothetical protein [Streptomyces sp. NPDC026673]|uniref:hypothetical protein n=1 Tax=Streptomyces sp. NPDC026673 TaxID=3155724 RepID=UPI0034043D79
MLLGSLRKAVSVALLAASLTTLSAACGRQQPATGVPPSDNAGGGPAPSAIVTPTPSTSAPGGPAVSASAPLSGNGAISTRRVYVRETTRGVPEVHTVLDNERDLSRFPGYFMKSDPKIADAIASRAARTDFSRSVLVAWSRTTGCNSTKDALLFRSGSRLVLGLAQSPMGQCLVANHVVVVFEVPRDRMPKEPRFAQERNPRADPPAPGRTVAFGGLEDIREYNGRRSAEVTSARQLEAFLAGLPRKGAAALREQLTRHPRRGDERRFAFVLTGCGPTGAVLTIGRRELSASPTGDEAIRCIQTQSYAAVLAVPSQLVPAHAQLID